VRLILNLIVICMIATGVGLGLTAYAVRHPLALDVIRDGAWSTIANEGGPDVDAYALAALAHRGEPPLAIADGLAFRAREDDEGRPLSGACTYVISGVVPPVRVWSLGAYDAGGRRFENPAGRYGFSAADVVRDGDGAIRITLSADARPGDWIPLSADADDITLVLRLYDTTAAAISGGRSAPDLPAITRTGCRS
jgi:hypothetical protein